MNLIDTKHVHFIGIGGIGISAIARMMLMEGREVSGSDSSESMIIGELRELGAKIFIGHSADQLENSVNLVVYTIAVPETNPELVEARRRKIKTLTYPEILGIVSKDKFTIAVSGTHGKTTTTAMIAHILIETRKDPTVIVGSLMKSVKTNFISGESEYFIVEACEYKRSFLNLSPRILIITNIDDDHLDYYGSIDGVQKAFREMIERLGPDGILITDITNRTIKPTIRDLKCTIVDYTQESILELNLMVPGKHNVANAQAALATARLIGVNEKDAISALNDFVGTWRRFEFKGVTKKGALVYDDYAHHPTEIKATLQGARERFPDSLMTIVFQPHLFSRTKEHLDEFANAFMEADNIIISPIFAAREPFDPTVSGEILAKKIGAVHKGDVQSFRSLKDISEYLLEKLTKDEVLITIGAGDVYKVAETLTAS